MWRSLGTDLLRPRLLLERAGHERKHQRPAASVLPEEDRLPRHLTPRPCVRDRATQQSSSKATQRLAPMEALTKVGFALQM